MGRASPKPRSLQCAILALAVLAFTGLRPDTGKADAALVASMLHYGEYTVSQIKEYLIGRGLKIRMASGA